VVGERCTLGIDEPAIDAPTARTPGELRGAAVFWQRTNQANVPGLQTAVDEEFFNGSLAQLRAFSAAVFAERKTLDALKAVQASA
jgi:hypothetical protein